MSSLILKARELPIECKVTQSRYPSSPGGDLPLREAKPTPHLNCLERPAGGSDSGCWKKSDCIDVDEKITTIYSLGKHVYSLNL